MYAGFYTAASGVLMNQRALNMVSENVANQQTPGYHAKELVRSTFEDELVRQQNGQTTPLGGGSPISVVAEEHIDFSQGEYADTNRVFDLAAFGNGFFTIQGQNGEVYTRNGNFNVDEEGYLVLSGVGRVLGENGPIRVGGSNFSVGPSGNVYDADANVLGRLRMEEPEDYNNLALNNDGTYTVQGGQMERVYPEIHQGVLEESNVDMNQQMTDAISYQRAFQSCSKALTIIDQMNQKTASDIGKL